MGADMEWMCRQITMELKKFGTMVMSFSAAISHQPSRLLWRRCAELVWERDQFQKSSLKEIPEQSG